MVENLPAPEIESATEKRGRGRPAKSKQSVDEIKVMENSPHIDISIIEPATVKRGRGRPTKNKDAFYEFKLKEKALPLDISVFVPA